MTTEYYYSAAWQVVETRRNSGIPRSDEPELATTLHEQYIWSPHYIDFPILRDRSTAGNGSLNERLYYLTDAQMNVTTLVDATGDPVERYTYDPYGNVTIYDGTWTNEHQISAYANEVLYCGYRLDNETGLYHVRYRNYHPLLGRWLQRDPLEYVDSMNVYEYCLGNPQNYLDPLGLGSDFGEDLADRDRKLIDAWGREDAQPFIDGRNSGVDVAQNVVPIIVNAVEINPLVALFVAWKGENVLGEEVGLGHRLLNAATAPGVAGGIAKGGQLVIRFVDKFAEAARVAKATRIVKPVDEVTTGAKTFLLCDAEKAAKGSKKSCRRFLHHGRSTRQSVALK